MKGAAIGLGLNLSLRALGTGGNPAAFASYPAPSGFRWDFVTDAGVVVTDGGIPVVDLVGA